MMDRCCDEEGDVTLADVLLKLAYCFIWGCMHMHFPYQLYCCLSVCNAQSCASKQSRSHPNLG
jgi:hypothetical protein